jgi:hypothetical protein
MLPDAQLRTHQPDYDLKPECIILALSMRDDGEKTLIFFTHPIGIALGYLLSVLPLRIRLDSWANKKPSVRNVKPTLSLQLQYPKVPLIQESQHSRAFTGNHC